LNKVILRPSSFAGWNDCDLREFFDKFQKLAEQKTGFKRPYRRQHIGATTGTAGHTGVTNALQRQIVTGEVPRLEDMQDEADAALIEGLNKDTDFDAVTKNIDDARYQLKRMIAATAPLVATIQPAQVELKLEHPLTTRDGVEYVLAGSFDVREENGTIRDLKFGKNVSVYDAQLGAYKYLAEKNGYPVTGLKVDHIKRVARSKPQPEAMTYTYDVEDSARVADHAAAKILDQVSEFIRTGDPWVFPTNPSSKLCTANWCSLYGTELCSRWKAKPTNTYED
jgi:hypothetical protein